MSLQLKRRVAESIRVRCPRLFRILKRSIHFASGRAQHFAHAVVEPQALRGIVQPRLGGKQRIKFIDSGRLFGFEDHAVPSQTIMDRRPERRGL